MFDSTHGYAQVYIFGRFNCVLEGVSLPLPLVERSEEEIAGIIRRKVETMKNVKSIRQVNVRLSGKRVDVDMIVLLGTTVQRRDPHKIALGIERKIMHEYPDARVTIHTEPIGNSYEDIWKLVKDIAEGTPGSRGVHNIHIQKIDKKLCVDLHLEVSANMTVKQAHDVADQVEEKIKAINPNISEITVHIESASDLIARELAGGEIELESQIEHIAEKLPEIKSISEIKIRKFGNILHLVLRCQFDPNLSIEKAHEASIKLERAIRNDCPSITRIDIHEEPA
jgi:divalent metal cation (Fe/Co/Zn/Cd) transporter